MRGTERPRGGGGGDGNRLSLAHIWNYLYEENTAMSSKSASITERILSCVPAAHPLPPAMLMRLMHPPSVACGRGKILGIAYRSEVSHPWRDVTL